MTMLEKLLTELVAAQMKTLVKALVGLLESQVLYESDCFSKQCDSFDKALFAKLKVAHDDLETVVHELRTELARLKMAAVACQDFNTAAYYRDLERKLSAAIKNTFYKKATHD